MKRLPWYHIIVSLTLGLPLVALLVYFYISSNTGFEMLQEAHFVEFPDAGKNYSFITDPDDYVTIYFDEKLITFQADLLIFNGIEITEGKVVVPIPDFVMINGTYYAVDEEGNLFVFDVVGFVYNSMFERTLVLGLNITLVIMTISIAIFLAFKKMDIFKRHRRLGVLLTSFMMTMIFLTLSMITRQMFLVFMVFTISWGIYYIEWLIYRKKHNLPLHDVISQRVVIVDE